MPANEGWGKRCPVGRDLLVFCLLEKKHILKNIKQNLCMCVFCLDIDYIPPLYGPQQSFYLAFKFSVSSQISFSFHIYYTFYSL